jgi:hypothetical protein
MDAIYYIISLKISALCSLEYKAERDWSLMVRLSIVLLLLTLEPTLTIGRTVLKLLSEIFLGPVKNSPILLEV